LKYKYIYKIYSIIIIKRILYNVTPIKNIIKNKIFLNYKTKFNLYKITDNSGHFKEILKLNAFAFVFKKLKNWWLTVKKIQNQTEWFSKPITGVVYFVFS
jgi:hypothetical protein